MIVSLGYTLFVVTVLFLLASMIFVWRFRKNPIVAVGQPSMLLVLCGGGLMTMMASLLFAMLSAPLSIFTPLYMEDWHCTLTIWFALMGSIVTSTVFMLKLVPVYQGSQLRRSSQGSQHRRSGQGSLVRRSSSVHVPSVTHVLVPFALMLAIAIALDFWAQIEYPPKYTTFEVSDDGFVVGRCHERDSMGYSLTLAAIAIVQIPVVFSILVFAWRIPAANELLSERRIIQQVCVVQLGFAVIHWAAYVLVIRLNVFGIEDSKEFFTIGAVSWIVFWCVMALSSVGFLILPRMYYLWHEHSHGQPPGNVDPFGRVPPHEGITATTISTTATSPQEQASPNTDLSRAMT